MEWCNTNQLKVDPPKRPKKITGTRFASILGLDRWNTPFKTWCAITRTYEDPFTENKYTRAGKIIEPKIVEYLRKAYFMEIKTPEDVYGKDYFRKTWGDFFPEDKIFGGMWDALLYEEGSSVGVIEVKSTKRSEDWINGAPDHYGLQGALYANRKGLDIVIMVCAFLEEKDYENPEDFVPSTENTILDMFRVSERYAYMNRHIARATDWWNEHVVTGISPAFDEKKDQEILKELRKNTIEADSDIETLIKEGESLKQRIENYKKLFADDEKRLKEITEALKKHCMEQFREGDKKVAIIGQTHEWVLSKTESTEIDKDALKADGLLNKYSKPKVTYRFTQTPIKEDSA